MEQTAFQVTTCDGQELSCARAGSGQVVMLVHGLGFRKKHWVHQVTALVNAGFTAVSFDLRGFGGSPLPDHAYDMAQLARDLEAVREHVGVECFHLVGHSLGGMVAVEYALTQPDRLESLTLASTTAHNGTRAQNFSRMMARLSREGSSVALADADFHAEVKAMMGNVVRYVAAEDMMPVLARMTAKPNLARCYAWLASSTFSRRKQISEILCPTFVMHGSADPIMPYAAGLLIHLGLPGSRWLPFYEGGHDLPRENSDEFSGALVSFLSELGDEGVCARVAQG